MTVLFSFLCAHGQISVTTMTTINQNRPQISHEKGIIRPRCTGPGINQAGEEMGQRRRWHRQVHASLLTMPFQLGSSCLGGLDLSGYAEATRAILLGQSSEGRIRTVGYSGG